MTASLAVWYTKVQCQIFFPLRLIYSKFTSRIGFNLRLNVD